MWQKPMYAMWDLYIRKFYFSIKHSPLRSCFVVLDDVYAHDENVNHICNVGHLYSILNSSYIITFSGDLRSTLIASL